MSTENLYNKEAREKIKELAESIDFTMMATDLKNQPFHVIPMSTKEVDEAGNIWFLSNKTSEHNQHIERENKTQLIYADKDNFEFLTIFGSAHVVTDRSRIKELYGSTDDTWFEGENDPMITALKIVPEYAHYWDTKNGKILSLIKMLKGAISGDKADLGIQGDLEV